MDLLKTKLTLLEDVQSEQSLSTKLAEQYRSTLEGLLQQLESLLAHNTRQQPSFRTKIGRSVYEGTLQFFNKITEQVHLGLRR